LLFNCSRRDHCTMNVLYCLEILGYMLLTSKKHIHTLRFTLISFRSSIRCKIPWLNGLFPSPHYLDYKRRKFAK
jgi:hypothetical protein